MDFFHKFLEWGLNGNVWIWFHIFGGEFYGKFARYKLDKITTFLSLFAITIAWELYEFLIDGGVPGMIAIYGSLERWAYDSAGDILGALLACLLVL